MPDAIFYPSDRTLVILLGASSWPNAKNFGESEAFTHSALSLRDYFLKDFHLPEANLLNLFDSPASPGEMLGLIKAFIDTRTGDLKQKGLEVKDLVLYYTGHGVFEDEKSSYLLAIKETNSDYFNASAIQIKSLADVLKKSARFLRQYIIIDACFSASALSFFQSPLEQVVASEVSKAFGEEGVSQEPATRGTSLLCSSSLKEVSKLAPDKQFTLFSEALLTSLRDSNWHGQARFSMADLKEKIIDYLYRKYDNKAPVPELHSPNQKFGDVAKIPFFPNLGKKEPERFGQHKPYVVDKTNVSCCVVLSESEEVSESWEALEVLVKKSLLNYKKSIRELAKKDVSLQPYVISASGVFSSEAAFQDIIKALCQSEIAVFDLTHYEPAVMFLLGIRSVVRRGITLASAGGDYVLGDTLDFPFNIKEVNIISHSEEQMKKDNPDQDPINLIGERIVSGFEQKGQLSNYLDLPTYDAVRNLPLESISQATRQYTDAVLVMCSFSRQYQDHNWKKYIKRNLPVYIRASLADEELSTLPKSKPQIQRTLDMKTPRLVSQSLYEAVRLTDMCVIDFTEWQPNVLFELGVRLAVNEINPVCIIEENYARFATAMVDAEGEEGVPYPTMNLEEKQYKRLRSYRQQCLSFLNQFKPIVYRTSFTKATRHEEETAYSEMIQRFLQSKKAVEGPEARNIVYDTITEWIDINEETAARSVYTELINSANLMNNPDTESYGRSPVLYPRNSELNKKSNEGGLERRIAAWLYLDARFTIEEIAADPDLLNTYKELANFVLIALTHSSKDIELRKIIRQKLRPLKQSEES